MRTLRAKSLEGGCYGGRGESKLWKVRAERLKVGREVCECSKTSTDLFPLDCDGTELLLGGGGTICASSSFL